MINSYGGMSPHLWTLCEHAVSRNAVNNWNSMGVHEKFHHVFPVFPMFTLARSRSCDMVKSAYNQIEILLIIIIN